MIRVENLTKTFDQFTAVKDISFQVDAGEIFAFLGPNGAGKTTTIKMLTTLLRPTAGRIHLDGFDPWVQPARGSPAVRDRVPGSEPRRRADRLREHGAARRPLPHPAQASAWSASSNCCASSSSGSAAGDLVKTFSGGMKRRLEIARGFLHTPKILFLDEPTLGLDPQSRNQLWTHVKALNEKEKRPSFSPPTTWMRRIASRIASRSWITARLSPSAPPPSSRRSTNTDSLEDAFLALTGTSLRDEAASSTDAMRRFAQMWQKRIKEKPWARFTSCGCAR